MPLSVSRSDIQRQAACVSWLALVCTSKGLIMTGLKASPLIVAIALSSAGAHTQPSSPNRVDRPASTGALDQFLLAQQVYSYGTSSRNVLAIIAAASIAGDFALREVHRKAQPDDRSAAAPAPAEIDKFVSRVQMLESARLLSGQNPVLLSLIEDLAAGTSKGRLPELASEQAKVVAASPDVYPIVFKANDPAEIVVLVAQRYPLSLTVVDEYDRPVCEDSNPSPADGGFNLSCRWTPAWTGPFKVTISNHGQGPVAYRILTN